MIRNHTFWQSMELPKSALERVQGVFLPSNASTKRDHFFWSKKGNKKVTREPPSHAVPTLAWPYREYQNR